MCGIYFPAWKRIYSMTLWATPATRKRDYGTPRRITPALLFFRTESILLNAQAKVLNWDAARLPSYPSSTERSCPSDRESARSLDLNY